MTKSTILLFLLGCHLVRECKTHSLKCTDLDCNVEPPLLENRKDLTTNYQVEYLFPTSSSSANIYIYQLSEGLAMRKILAHSIRMQKNPQTRGDTF